LQASDFFSHRPDALHRRLLAQHLLRIISAATDPVHVSTLYSLSPHSGAFQIQRALSDLLRIGQIERPARGFYTLAPANPTLPLNTPATTTPTTELNTTATITPNPTDQLNTTATTTPNPTGELHVTATTIPTNELNVSAAITSNTELTNELNVTATITPNPTDQLHVTATTTLKPTTTKASNLRSSRPHKGRNKHKNTKKRR
jgi:hypothetical protein